jgi:hypothetical protein
VSRRRKARTGGLVRLRSGLSRDRVLVRGLHRLPDGPVAVIANSESGRFYRSPVDWIARGREDRARGAWHYETVTWGQIADRNAGTGPGRGPTHGQKREIARQLASAAKGE